MKRFKILLNKYVARNKKKQIRVNTQNNEIEKKKMKIRRKQREQEW